MAGILLTLSQAPPGLFVLYRQRPACDSANPSDASENEGAHWQWYQSCGLVRITSPHRLPKEAIAFINGRAGAQ